MHHLPIPLEVPVFNTAAARTAVAHGARRLEVNRTGSYAAGGLTPSPEEVAAVAAAVPDDVPLRIMIRPRGPPPKGPDFVYSAAEIEAMCTDLAAFVASGVLKPARGDGFVFGILEETGRDIDIDRNAQLVAAAAPYGYACIFHRAMDGVLATTTAVEALAALRYVGFSGVLTAGGPDSRGAAEHASMLQSLVAAATAAEEATTAAPAAPATPETTTIPFPLEIVVGGGVRSTNAATLAREVLRSEVPTDGPAVVFHASCLRAGTGAAEEVDGNEVERLCTVLSEAGRDIKTKERQDNQAFDS